MGFDHRKYRRFREIGLANRKWPDRRIERAPRWCSVDLRDGNQALIEPMSPSQKMKFFDLLVEIGFSEIEVGFPAASKADFDFIRLLIDEKKIPDQVTIQVLTQARREIIERTFEAVRGAKRVIMHVYNPTSPLQRKMVFNLDRAGIIKIAVDAARDIQRRAALARDTDWTFQYSPESFSATELDFAVEICNCVSEIWQPTPERPMIMTLPATVEMATPNVYADQVEWFCDNLKYRESVIVSTHTHNDRGCAVAAAELGVMAGAQRVEGTLLGNGERTGNMDILVMAMNLYSQGIDPMLDLSDMDRIVSRVTSCTRIDLHPRHPYCGDLVFTAFSGGHQDAIRKCLGNYRDGDPWEVAYLPIDPRDIGRTYQDVIRVNSQSGKGGVAYVLESRLGVRLPRWLQIDFSQIVQKVCDDSGQEIRAESIWLLFQDHYLKPPGELKLKRLSRAALADGEFTVTVSHRGAEAHAHGDLRNPEQFVRRLSGALSLSCDVLECQVHPLGDQAGAMAYTRLKHGGVRDAGVAMGSDATHAFVMSALSALDHVAASKKPPRERLYARDYAAPSADAAERRPYI